jgi:hypothetical protein
VSDPLRPPDTPQEALAQTWDEEPEPGVWEPWMPMVGQRVRCVPSPECPVVGRNVSPAIRNGFPPGHHPSEYGMTGIVCRPGLFPMPDDLHPHLVLWDRAIVLPNGERTNCSGYAAIELEPLDDADEGSER